MSQPIPLYPPQASTQAFPYLQEIIQRYRRNVHHLEPGAPPTSLQNASERLGFPLPKSLESFLKKWNGGALFRNALQIRSTMELAFADRRKKNIVLFADTDNGQRWAYAQNGEGGFVFGLWAERSFVPLHRSFEGWLDASLRLLDEGPFPSEQHLAMRKRFDSTSGYLFFLDAESSLREGRLEEAQQQVQKGLSLDRASCRSWSLLGDCLRPINLKATYNSYLESIKRLHFPVPYLKFLPVDCRFIQEMSTLTSKEDDRWFVELRNIWNNRIADVRCKEEFRFVERIACTIAQEYVRQGAYFTAKEFLLAFLDKSEVFTCRELPVQAQLLLADIYIQIGNHDDAERLLRALQYTDESLSVAVNLRIARIATVRQEPWGLDILFSLLEQTRDPAHLAEIWLLAGQYYVALDDVDQAAECIEQAQLLVATDPYFACQLDLLCGDVARTRNQIGLAEQFYQKATSRNETLKNPLLEGRILFHRGELLRRCNEHSKAQQYCLKALQIFQNHHCAFDEGLVRTSLGHYGKDSWLAAKKIFIQLDWAIGVSNVDQLMGEKSISWHIDQCQEHTRRRVRAQKALPPLQRLDAEMPERREFGHRMAIINYDETVLDTLSREMLSAERELRSPSILPSHQKYARFVACVELISQYPSYRAGEIILRLVKDDHTIGIARKALLRILSRTRNLSVVEGLMEIIEPGTIQAGRLLAIEALGWRKEQTAIPLLLNIVTGDGSGAIKRAAIIALGRIGDPSVVDVLLQHVDNPLIAEQTAISLLLLGEWSGLDRQAQALAQGHRGASQTLGHIVGRYGGASYLLLLLNAAQSKDPVAISAVQGLGYLGDARIIPKLIEWSGSRNIPFAHAASQALEMITGHFESLDEYLLKARWSDWWEKNDASFEGGTRYRYGEKMSPGLLIDRLNHDDLLVRRACYDELVIYTGVSLPFDAEGPWRTQVLQRKAWRQWWEENRLTFPTGKWVYQGDLLA